MITNLDADGTNNNHRLEGSWDGSDSNNNGIYIDENSYEYQTTVKVYDQLGSTHDIGIFYDPGRTASSYEFIVTCNPSEDNRSTNFITGVTDDALGLLGRGVLSFNEASGEITGMTFDRYQKNSGLLTDIDDPVVVQGEYTPTAPVSSGTYTGTSTLNYTFTTDTAGTIGGTIGTATEGVAYGPTTPVATGSFTGTSSTIYTFTVDTAGAIDGATAIMAYTNTEATDTGLVTLTGASQLVSNGLYVDFGVATEVLVAGDTFTVACTPKAAMDWADDATTPVTGTVSLGYNPNA